MSNPPTPPLPSADDVIKRGQAAGTAVHDAVNETLQDPLKASQAASDAIAHAISHSAAINGVIQMAFLALTPLLTGFFTVLDDVRHGVTKTMGGPTAAILNEFLGTEFDSSVVTPAGGGDATIAKARAIGAAILKRLESEFAPQGFVDPVSGERAAETFAGYGVNFGIQNAIISIIGSFVPECHLDDLRELGVEVAQNLGLGRLVRQALRPLVQATIATPYTRQLNARYHPNLPAQGEVAKAYHAGRIPQDQVSTWFSELGLTEQIVAEVIEQTRERLKAAEWNILVAIGDTPADPNALEDHAVGMDPAWAAYRQAALNFTRTKPARERVLSEMLSQVKAGFVTQQAFADFVQTIGIPQDEQTLWVEAAAVFTKVSRKRLSQADMLFLYEAAQVTDLDVEQWATAEGYSDDDTQRLLTFFRLKQIAAAHTTTSTKAARVHAEHVAYVTDQISGLWSRPPTTDELNYWVQLLDSGQRTKADFLTELKALSPSGPAKP